MTESTAPRWGRQQGAARRHYLTLLFADLSGSTRLCAELETEIYAQLLGALEAVYRRVLARHGGLLARIQGDGVLAVFGHPDTLEDDGRRAVEAALELHAEVRALAQDPTLELRHGLTLHTGIHAGLVLVGDGDALRGLFELMGNVPNLAARLCDHAAADEIWVTEETLGPFADRFATQREEALQLPGIAKPVAALRVQGSLPLGGHWPAVSPPLPGISAHSPALVGRERELERLCQAWRDCVATRSVQRFAIVGAAGHGKSRLARALLERLSMQGVRVLRGACEPGAADAVLRPLLQLVRAALGVSAGVRPEEIVQRLYQRWPAALRDHPASLPALLQALTMPAGAADLGPQWLDRLAHAVTQVVRHWCERAPVVLFIDDWHGADDASHRVFSRLAAEPDLPLLLVLAARELRPEDGDLISRLQCIELGPLTHADAARLVREHLPQADPFTVEQLCQQAGGHPLFLEELCHRAAQREHLPKPGRPQERSAWLAMLIESRVSRLPEASQVLLRSASVLGMVVPAALLERLCKVGAEDEALQRLLQEGLLQTDADGGEWRFRHALVHEAVYQTVGLHQRRALHRLAVQALLAPEGADAETAAAPGGLTPDVTERAETLAYHCASAGDAALAAQYAELAARRSMRLSALDRAQAQLRLALRSLDQLEPNPKLSQRWCAVAQLLGLMCVFDPARSDLPLFERAVRLSEPVDQDFDPALRGRAQYWLAYIHYALGDQAQALLCAAIAQQLAHDQGDLRLQAQVHALQGQALMASGRSAEAQALLLLAINSKQQHRGEQFSVGLVYSWATLAMAQADLGHFDAADQALARAVAITGAGLHQIAASLHGVRAAVLLWESRWAEAAEAGAQARAVGQKVRSVFSMSMGLAAGAYAQWRADGGVSTEATLRDLQAALAWVGGRGNRLFESLCHGWLADVAAASSDRALARHHAAQALQRARQHDPLGAPMACRALARLCAARDEGGQAQRWMRRAGRLAQQRGSVMETLANARCAEELLKARQP